MSGIMLDWSKPEELPTYGLVYITACRRYSIHRRKGEKTYRLIFGTTKKSFDKLRDAKEAAEQDAQERF